MRIKGFSEDDKKKKKRLNCLELEILAYEKLIYTLDSQFIMKFKKLKFVSVKVSRTVELKPTEIKKFSEDLKAFEQIPEKYLNVDQ